MFSVVNIILCMLFAAHQLPDSPVGIIAGSAVAVVLCMLIVIIMVVIFLRRSVCTFAVYCFCCFWTPCNVCTRQREA